MPDEKQPTSTLTPLQSAWLQYVDDLSTLLVPDLDDHALYQHVQFRDNVLARVKSQAFLDGLEEEWGDGEKANDVRAPKQLQEIKDLLIMELKSFGLALKATPP